MRNVQRTASCGAAGAHAEVREGDCLSNEIQSGEIALNVAIDEALNSNPPLLDSAWEAGAVLLVEAAQHDLFAQQPGLHAFWAGASERMQVRAGTLTGAIVSATSVASEVVILLSIGKFYSTRRAGSRSDLF